MTQNATNLKPRLAKLSKKDRAELAKFLIETLDDEADDEVEEAWEKELARRWEEIESGKAKGIPADKVFKRLREKYS